MFYTLLFLFFLPNVQAAVTHVGKLDAKLVLIDSTGKEEKIGNETGDFTLDWYTKKCEVRLNKEYTFDCVMDNSQDLKNANGELVMQAIPQVVVPQSALDILMITLAKSDKNFNKIASGIVFGTSAERKLGMLVPFYTCQNGCEKTGKDAVIFNAFQSYVTRDVVVKHPHIKGKKLILSLTLKSLKAYGGAFHIIGNNNQGNFSR